MSISNTAESFIPKPRHSRPDAGVAKRSTEAWDDLYGATDTLVWGSAPAPFLEEHLSRIRPLLGSGTSVLDAAAGEGRHIDLLLETGAHVFACDLSMNGMKKFPSETASRVHRLRCDVTAMPIGDNSLTAAVMIDAIETLPSVEVVLQEIHRILKPGGVFICNIPGFDDGIASGEMCSLQDGGFLYHSKYYYRFYSEGQARRILIGCGFAVEEAKHHVWWEAPHPAFRTKKHLHRSMVFRVRKE
jgi:SAM-dependent methyltransferase